MPEMSFFIYFNSNNPNSSPQSDVNESKDSKVCGDVFPLCALCPRATSALAQRRPSYFSTVTAGPRAPGHQAEPSSSQQQGHAASQACARVRALSGPSCNTHTQVVLFPLCGDAYLDHHRSKERPLSLNGEPLRYRL